MVEDDNSFLNKPGMWWWNEKQPKKMMAKLKDGSQRVVNEYFQTKPNVAARFNKFWEKLEAQLVKEVNKCLDLSGTELEVARKRRDDDEERGILSGDLELEGDANTDFWAVFWGHATYIKETLLANDNCNQRRAMEQLRRIDRYRFLMEWQYCDKVDINYDSCHWVWYKGWGDNPGTEPRGNPRKWASFKTGGQYNRFYNQ